MKHPLNISEQNPGIADHFPGNPIVPGAVILDRVAMALKNEIGNEIDINKISRAKFLSPLKAGIPAIIEFNISGNTAIFICSSEGSKIATGQLEFNKL